MMDTTLPDFSDPPVVEVALAVQFEPLANIRTPQIGLLWSEFRREFPDIEEHAPLAPMVERFGVTGAPKTSVRFEMVQKPPVPRCWFLNKDGTQLVQVQQDRIAHNWRKGESGGVYPRYESIRETFKNELRVFGDFLIREGIGAWVPDLCEITYINQILPNSEWHDHGQLSKILTLFTDRETEEFLPPPEDAQLNCRYVIPGDEGDPIGRLHISVRPAFRRVDDRPIYLLDLVARGVPAGEGIEGVLRFLDLGRTWVVKAFVSITTPEMQTIWGRVR